MFFNSLSVLVTQPPSLMSRCVRILAKDMHGSDFGKASHSHTAGDGVVASVRVSKLSGRLFKPAEDTDVRDRSEGLLVEKIGRWMRASRSTFLVFVVDAGTWRYGREALTYKCVGAALSLCDAKAAGDAIVKKTQAHAPSSPGLALCITSYSYTFPSTSMPMPTPFEHMKLKDEEQSESEQEREQESTQLKASGHDGRLRISCVYLSRTIVDKLTVPPQTPSRGPIAECCWVAVKSRVTDPVHIMTLQNARRNIGTLASAWSLASSGCGIRDMLDILPLQTTARL